MAVPDLSVITDTHPVALLISGFLGFLSIYLFISGLSAATPRKAGLPWVSNKRRWVLAKWRTRIWTTRYYGEALKVAYDEVGFTVSFTRLRRLLHVGDWHFFNSCYYTLRMAYRLDDPLLILCGGVIVRATQQAVCSGRVGRRYHSPPAVCCAVDDCPARKCAECEWRAQAYLADQVYLSAARGHGSACAFWYVSLHLTGRLQRYIQCAPITLNP